MTLDIVNSMQCLSLSVLNNLSEIEIEGDVNESLDFEESTQASFAIVSSFCEGDNDSHSDSEGDEINSQFTV